MSDGVHVVNVHVDGTAAGTHYELDEEALKKILLADNVKNKPVAIVSVAGAYRGGKSFLLNFFLRYLAAPVVVFLMDTQGTFDDTSSIRDNSTIFALSTMLASTQIYNIKNNIMENDLQTLQLFTDYGKLVNGSSGKPFQVLEFLIRDWINPFEHPYGHAGGEKYLEKKLKVLKGQPKELQDLRRHITTSFEKVTCFLLPIPSLEIANPDFKGKIVELQPAFVNGIKELVTSIFSKDNIAVKKFGEQTLTCGELFNYFKTYLNLYNSDKNPTPKTILTATTEAGLLLAASEASRQYEDNMRHACGPEAPSMPDEDVVLIHDQELASAKVTFDNKKLFGDKELIDTTFKKVFNDLSKRRDDFLEINRSKTLTAQNRGNAAYAASLEELRQGKILCVHSKDLKAVHEDAFQKAIRCFDANRRKPIEGKRDTEREKYIDSFRTRYEVLRLTNEQNNKANASEVKMDYSQFMITKCNQKPKLTPEQFAAEHETSKSRALAEFDARRNRANNYDQDTFKYQLEQDILLEFELLKQINASSNTEAFQNAIRLYSSNFLSLSEIRKHCLHPDDLRKDHERAMCLSMKLFRPNITCDINYKPKDNDETILMNVFNNRYESLSDINNTANEAAVNEAYIKYKEKFEAQRGFFYFLASWDTATEYHNNALADAYDVFYSKRRDRNYHTYDEYKERLIQKAKHYYDPDNKA